MFVEFFVSLFAHVGLFAMLFLGNLFIPNVPLEPPSLEQEVFCDIPLDVEAIAEESSAPPAKPKESPMTSLMEKSILDEHSMEDDAFPLKKDLPMEKKVEEKENLENLKDEKPEKPEEVFQDHATNKENEEILQNREDVEKKAEEMMQGPLNDIDKENQEKEKEENRREEEERKKEQEQRQKEEERLKKEKEQEKKREKERQEKKKREKQKKDAQEKKKKQEEILSHFRKNHKKNRQKRLVDLANQKSKSAPGEGGDTPITDPQSSSSYSAGVVGPLALSIADRIRRVLQNAITLPLDINRHGAFYVTLSLVMNGDGTVKSYEILKGQSSSSHPLYTQGCQKVRESLEFFKQQPLPFPSEHYDYWKTLTLTVRG